METIYYSNKMLKRFEVFCLSFKCLWWRLHATNPTTERGVSL